jgi:hypothetical protein
MVSNIQSTSIGFDFAQRGIEDNISTLLELKKKKPQEKKLGTFH